jgi:Flp pilus assembly protein TadG
MFLRVRLIRLLGREQAMLQLRRARGERGEPGKRGERGSAVADFTLVAPLVLALVVTVAQLVLVWYVRVMVTSAAQEGARSAARAGSSVGEVSQAVSGRLSGSLAEGLVSRVDVGFVREVGYSAARVQIQSRLPVLGLLGPNAMTVVGFAPLEQW